MQREKRTVFASFWLCPAEQVFLAWTKPYPLSYMAWLSTIRGKVGVTNPLIYLHHIPVST